MTDSRPGKRRRSATNSVHRDRTPPAAPRDSDVEPHREALLDASLEATFPASDPIPVNPRFD